jgi:hypothetical protein
LNWTGSKFYPITLYTLAIGRLLDGKKVEEVVRGEVKQERWKQVKSIPQGVVLD